MNSVKYYMIKTQKKNCIVASIQCAVNGLLHVCVHLLCVGMSGCILVERLPGFNPKTISRVILVRQKNCYWSFKILSLKYSD